jgi:hypothetical protein
MFLLQDPVPIIVLGIIAVAVLGAMLLSTGRGVFLIAMLGAIGVTLLGVGIEWLVVTEQERVEAAMDNTAAALVSNDIDTVLACCTQSADFTRGQARLAIRRIEFLKIKLTSVEIDDINYLTSQPTVTANFNAVITASDRSGQFGTVTRPIGFTLHLRKESDRWLITSHELKGAPGEFSKKR